jgi:putative DNA methylase
MLYPMPCNYCIYSLCKPSLFKKAGRGWSNIIDKYARAKAYCDNVFEVKHQDNRKTFVYIKEEWIGDARRIGGRMEKRNVELHCGSSTICDLPPASVDAVFTDPPYFTNVQYAELMDFCYVWLRQLAQNVDGCFDKASTRDSEELTGNTTMERGLEHFAEGLSAVFTKMAAALKPGSPLAFTYHHNTIEAYFPVAVAILDSGLKCSASIPCPAEMGASIHINGTGSSIVDTVLSVDHGERSRDVPLALRPPKLQKWSGQI